MREILDYPVLSQPLIEQVHQELLLLRHGFEQLQEDSCEPVAAQMQTHLYALYQLIRKELALPQLKEMMSIYTLPDLATLLLQPKAPAVFDLDADEVAEILMLMYQPNTFLACRMYYAELLQKSLLLSQIENEIPAFSQPLTSLDAQKLAKVLIEKSKDASELIVL